MNNDIFGIIILFIFASPFIALIIIIAFKIYRKFRPAQAKIEAEKRRENKLRVLLGLHTPASPQQDMLNFVVVTGLVVLAGLLVGILASIFSHLIYMIFVFPLMVGVAAGNMIRNAIRMAKIRKASQLIFLSLLPTVTIYGPYHYGRYVWLQV